MKDSESTAHRRKERWMDKVCPSSTVKRAGTRKIKGISS